MKELHKKDMGSVGEALVIAQILENDNSAFVDFGDNSKVDIIVEAKDRLHKVQVKTVGREKKIPDSSILYLYKSGPNYSFTYDESMIDWFALVDAITKKIAWISAKEALTRKRQFVLRHIPAKNGQKKNIRMFDDYTNYPFD